MRKLLVPGIVATMLVFGTACATNTEGSGKIDAKAAAAISAAKASKKKASSVGGEWRDTGKMIKKAEKLAEEGKTEKAIKMANKAEKQGQLGYKQANEQKGATLRQ